MAVIVKADPNGFISEDHWMLIYGRIRYIYLSDDIEKSNVDCLYSDLQVSQGNYLQT